MALAPFNLSSLYYNESVLQSTTINRNALFLTRAYK
jgi:hypothetical protein